MTSSGEESTLRMCDKAPPTAVPIPSGVFQTECVADCVGLLSAHVNAHCNDLFRNVSQCQLQPRTQPVWILGVLLTCVISRLWKCIDSNDTRRIRSESGRVVQQADLCFSCVTCVSALCVTCVSAVCHVCFSCVSRVFQLCVTCVSAVCHVCFSCVCHVCFSRVLERRADREGALLLLRFIVSLLQTDHAHNNPATA